KDFCFNSARFFSIPFGLPFSNRLAVNDLVGVNLYSNFSLHTHRFMDKQSGVSVHNRCHAFRLFSAHPFIACNPRSSQSGILDLGSKSQDCCPDIPHTSALFKTGTTFKNVGA
ncbi:MAG: hypothetical protein ACPGRS_15995, partial [bacterium]